MSRTAQSPDTHLGQDAQSVQGGVCPGGAVPEYMPTLRAASYLCMSVSRLLRLGDLEYLRGRPNVYRRADLDDWFERNKFRVRGK